MHFVLSKIKFKNKNNLEIYLFFFKKLYLIIIKYIKSQLKIFTQLECDDDHDNDHGGHDGGGDHDD